MRGQTFSDIIDQIILWLKEFDIPANSLRRYWEPSRVVVFLQTQAGYPYSINIFENGNNVIFESVISKAPSGPPEKTLGFYRTLLGYNAGMPFLKFAVIQIEEDCWHLVLNDVQNANYMQDGMVLDVLEYCNLAYVRQIPKVIDLANELGLKFDGKLDDGLTSMINGILQ